MMQLISWFRDMFPLAALQPACGLYVSEKSGSQQALLPAADPFWRVSGSFWRPQGVCIGKVMLLTAAISPASFADRRHVSDPLVNC